MKVEGEERLRVDSGPGITEKLANFWSNIRLEKKINKRRKNTSRANIRIYSLKRLFSRLVFFFLLAHIPLKLAENSVREIFYCALCPFDEQNGCH